MKKILYVLVTMFCLMPLMASAKSAKVKVYIFEAGGCPYCEAEVEYLEGLDSYNKKFEIVRKEAYVDHVDWEKGKDYDLAVQVANAFQEVGFENATYNGTPFVVISDVYAETAYSEKLEEVINKVYEDGDKDIVGCYESGKTDCLDHMEKVAPTTGTTTSSSGSNAGTIVAVIISTIIIIVVYLVKSTADTNKILEARKK